MPNPTKPEPRGPLLRRQSHKQMKRLIDAIVETGLVHVQDGAGPFNSIISREGKNGVMADVLKVRHLLHPLQLGWVVLCNQETTGHLHGLSSASLLLLLFSVSAAAAVDKAVVPLLLPGLLLLLPVLLLCWCWCWCYCCCC